jgi:hypothetical protein
MPWYQWLLTGGLRHGNEKCVTGLDGWLFFADDLASAYGPGYLEPGLGGQEALAAIEDFHRQLAARGIDLLLIPSFSKEMLDGDRLARSTRPWKSIVNPDLPRFYAELEARGIDFVRMQELFEACRAAQADPGAPLALPRDTHWTPATMAFCAERIAARAREVMGEEPWEPSRFERTSQPVAGDGDLVRMLSLPEGQTLFEPMRIEVEPIVDALTKEPLQFDEFSDVLLMGDSLTKIFSDPALGLGALAGLGEHLSLHLDRPLDVIARAGGSATATREALARREDPLLGKRLVIWQFGVRMLASGPQEWRLVEMPGPSGDADPTFDPLAGVSREKVTIVGEIVEVSKIPRQFEYEFCLAVHEYKVLEVVDGALDEKVVWVAHVAIDKGEDLPPRGFTVGMRHRMVLQDLRLHYDLEDTGWFDETKAGRVIHFPLEYADAR